MTKEGVDSYHLTVADLKILGILLSSTGTLDSFTVYRRSKFGLRFFFERYSRLLKLSFVSEENNVVRLTSTGRDLIRFHLPRLSNARKKWREVPSRFIGARLPGGDFYVPNIELLSNNLFPN